jgi:hypothetical protein
MLRHHNSFDIHVGTPTLFEGSNASVSKDAFDVSALRADLRQRGSLLTLSHKNGIGSSMNLCRKRMAPAQGSGYLGVTSNRQCLPDVERWGVKSAETGHAVAPRCGLGPGPLGTSSGLPQIRFLS